MLRPIIKIDEEKCNGCGKCITDCAEGALAIVDGKAKLISETYCDGLGACLDCPMGALSLEMQNAPAFDEEAALLAKAKRDAEMKKGGQSGNALALQPLQAGCASKGDRFQSTLKTWPIQLELVNPHSAWLANSHILLAAHCSAFASEAIRQEMNDKILIIACPKLESREKLIKKLAEIIETANPASITILRMSVPCCGGLETIVEEARKIMRKNTPVLVETINL